jgi:SAM-dependent methyltransferase
VTVPQQTLSSYTHAHRHFYTPALPPLLIETVSEHRGGVIADLGAGDGATLWALEQRGLLGETAYAVDLSPERVARAEAISPKIRGIVADATHVDTLADGSVDGVIVSQVIEHLENDRALAPEIARLLGDEGWWYIGTVLRERRAWWVYRVDGRWQLDPTHVREYASERDLLAVLEHPLLRIDRVKSTPLTYPVLDLALRGAASVRVLPRDALSGAYALRPALAQARRIRLRVPGYRLLEASGGRQ